jgi:hypothetical protein
MTDQELAERLKSFASDFEFEHDVPLNRITVSRPTGCGRWSTIEVRVSSSIYDNSPDGWETQITEGSL